VIVILQFNFDIMFTLIIDIVAL